MSLIKELREETGSPINQCKKALEQYDGDMNQAKNFLQKQGLASVAKKMTKEAREGVIAVQLSQDQRKYSMIEVNCQTDFVARTEEFIQFTDCAIQSIHQNSENLDQTEDEQIQDYLKNKNVSNPIYPSCSNLYDTRQQIIMKLQENINISRISSATNQSGIYGYYLHNAKKSNIGEKTCVVRVESSSNAEEIIKLANNIAIQIIAMKPLYISKNDIPQEILNSELDKVKTELGDKVKGKPQQVLDKMFEGKMRKFYEDNVLFEQDFVLDNDDVRKVKDLVSTVEKEVNDEITVKDYIIWQCK